MLKAQFDKAWNIAISDQDLSGFDDSTLFGCGLKDFNPVRVPIEAVAKMLRYQCFYIMGDENSPRYDGQELENMRHILCYPRRAVEVICS